MIYGRFSRARNPRRNGVWVPVRSASTPDKGNVKDAAEQGFEKIEMQFLSDVYIRCPDCDGQRYRRTSCA